jgi:hypothetical protein
VSLVERALHSPGGRRSEHRLRHATRPREEPTPGWRCSARRSCGHVLDDEHRVVVDVAFANLNHSKRPTAKRDRVRWVATTGRWSGTSADRRADRQRFLAGTGVTQGAPFPGPDGVPRCGGRKLRSHPGSSRFAGGTEC